jgi:S-adenosylmethionine:tRNA ribosyltransferase-isomerase
MRTADFDFELPGELIAQTPTPARDASRLLILDRQSGKCEHGQFRDLLNHLAAGDVLVLNNSRVIPARVRGSNARTGGRFEILLLEQSAPNQWWTLLRPGKRARVGTRVLLADVRGRHAGVEATVVGVNGEGHRELRFTGTPDIVEALEQLGEVPLPPYIQRTDATHSAQDRERYQTVFAQPPGSVAAPTAGLHFTEQLLDELRRRGVRVCFVTLHVGLGTFAPVKTEDLSAHLMHEERYYLTPETAHAIMEAKQDGHRIIAVGTTSLRVLESAATAQGLAAGHGRTRLFVHPPYQFKTVDHLLTNFHLPRSTLLMLVSAFAAPGETRGRDLVLAAYREAIRMRYRFFSYGDAMLIL